jgi:hypothetical protein
MILILSLIGIVWAITGLCDDYDHEAKRRNDYRIAERRHREKLDAIRNSSTSRGSVRRTRTIVKDEHGRILAQEVEEEFIPDMDEEEIIPKKADYGNKQ